jgi:hypothetical protein
MKRRIVRGVGKVIRVSIAFAATAILLNSSIINLKRAKARSSSFPLRCSTAPHVSVSQHYQSARALNIFRLALGIACCIAPCRNDHSHLPANQIGRQRRH